MTRKKTTRKPAAPPWMKDSWKSANRKPLEDFTLRDIIHERRRANRAKESTFKNS